MQVFNNFFKIIRRNLPMLIMYSAIFVILTLILSNIGAGEEQSSFEETQVKLTVIDRDKSVISQSLAAYLASHHTIIEQEDDPERLQDALYNRNTEYILFIPRGYGSALTTGDDSALETAQIPGSYSGAYVDRQIQGYTAALKAYIAAGYTPESAVSAVTADLEVKSEVTMPANSAQEMPPVFYFYKYLSYALMMLMIFSVCPVLIAYGKRDLSMRINASALSIRVRTSGLALGTVVLAAIYLAVFFIFGLALYQVEMFSAGSLLCLINAVAFIIVSASMALLIGQVSRSINMVNSIANVAVLALCFLGGVYVPLELTTPAIRAIAQFLPTYWYVQAAESSIAVSRLTYSSVLPVFQSIGVQLCFAAALFSVSLVITKQKQRVA